MTKECEGETGVGIAITRMDILEVRLIIWTISEGIKPDMKWHALPQAGVCAT
jgi:hypothetical protein